MVIFAISAVVFKVSAEKERRPIKSRFPVPSERWVKHPSGTQ